MEKNKPKTDSELREIYNSSYPLPSFLYFISGFLSLLMCAGALFYLKHSYDEGYKIFFLICILIFSSISVKLFKTSWNFSDFNLEAERFFREKGR